MPPTAHRSEDGTLWLLVNQVLQDDTSVELKVKDAVDHMQHLL
jgi:hypothetical protein